MPANHRDFLDSLENEQSAPCNALHIFTKDKPGCIQALRSSRYEIQWAAVGPQNFSLCFAEPRYEPTVSASGDTNQWLSMQIGKLSLPFKASGPVTHQLRWRGLLLLRMPLTTASRHSCGSLDEHPPFACSTLVWHCSIDVALPRRWCFVERALRTPRMMHNWMQSPLLDSP